MVRVVKIKIIAIKLPKCVKTEELVKLQDFASVLMVGLEENALKPQDVLLMKNVKK